jgi:hypothetical protein
MPQVVTLVRLVLVLAVGLSTQGLLLMQTLFVLRQDAIVERLCVNRDRPELECEGTCFLTQRLHEHQERETERSAALLEVLLVAMGVAVPASDAPTPPTADAHWPGAPPHRAAAGADGGVFRPPRGEVRI